MDNAINDPIIIGDTEVQIELTDILQLDDAQIANDWTMMKSSVLYKNSIAALLKQGWSEAKAIAATDQVMQNAMTKSPRLKPGVREYLQSILAVKTESHA